MALMAFNLGSPWITLFASSHFHERVTPFEFSNCQRINQKKGKFYLLEYVDRVFLGEVVVVAELFDLAYKRRPLHQEFFTMRILMRVMMMRKSSDRGKIFSTSKGNLLCFSSVLK